MKQSIRAFRLCLFLMVLALLQSSASANSSWRWISETRPYDVLPWVALATILLETTAVVHFAKTPVRRTFLVVLLANLLSFVAPYLFGTLSHPIYSLEQLLKHTPFFTVGTVYLVMTLLVEIPVVWLLLRKQTQKHKLLLAVVFGSNVITTLLTGLTERLLCYGQW